jgi:hypothetical protein
MRNEELAMRNERVKKVKITPIKIALLFSFFILLFSFAISCENPTNPFKAGLGPIVDIRPPTVKLISPEVDTFIRGVVTFTGTAEDDYKLVAVYIKVANHPDLAANPWPDWTPVDILKKDGKWSATIDTVGFDERNPIFPDGDFMIRLKAVDSVGKWAGDEDIVFQLKNRPPIVSLTLPSVTEGEKEGEAGSTKLNFGFAGDFNGSNGVFPAIRILDTGAVLTGMIRDNEGVVFETADAVLGDDGTTVVTGEKRPPQFRFWRVNPNPSNPNDPGGYSPGVYPTVAQIPWKDFAYEDDTADSNLMEVGANEYLFTHKIPHESDRYYGFEVRAQSKDNTEFLYPKDYLPPSWWASSSVPQETKNENQYVLFYARLPQEYPTLDLYQLQNIFGENAWNEAVTPPRYDDIPGVDVNSYHPYVNSTAVFKSGAFTLRAKASHSRFVDEARVFWERSDKTSKGLFIWDPANKTPYPGWNPGNNIPTARPFEQWGYYDSNQKDTRNFIFTYNGVESLDTIPDTSEYNPLVRGKYKIQKYIGSETDWKNDTTPANWVDYTNPNPQNGKKLEEGAYEINGETVNGNSLISKYLCTITIDEQGPEVNLNGIDGSLGDGLPDGSKAYTLNGVVRPRFGIYDARARDSGLRLGPTDYYKRANGRIGDELRYMVVHADDKARMDTYLNQDRWNGNPWPQVPNVATGMAYNTIYQTIYEKPYTDADSGITIHKNGPILDGSFMFKATKIYEASSPEDVLADGDYRIYALARDNAFNVTWASFPVKVDAASDIPGLVWVPDDAISEDVTDPSVSADTDAITGNGFVVGDGSGGRKVRNKFNANTSLTMRLSDDDSLNLGDTRTSGAGDPGVAVTITGTSSTSAGVVTPYSAYEMMLSKEDILGVFLGQPLDGTVRRPVLERRGTIPQSMLLAKIRGDHLPPSDPIHTNWAHPYNRMFGTDASDNTPEKIKAKKDAYTGSGLPEGIYRIRITVGDYPPAKLRLPWEGEPIAAEKVKEIWIAVDSTPPAIDRDSILPKENEFLSAKESMKITGIVSDKNGPVTLKSFTSNPNLNLSQVITYRQTGATDIWEAEFEAPVNLGGNTGAFTFYLEFQDRFGNTNQPFPIRYSADDEPPVVSLSNGGSIRTFERDEKDVILYDPLGTKSPTSDDSDNKLRLTNGVVRFAISATDNSGKIDGLRWWLLPAGKGAVGPAGPGAYGLNDTGVVTDFNAYPFPEFPLTLEKGKVNYLASGGAYGEFDPENRPYVVYLDTELLHGTTNAANPRGGDGEYRLHAIAIDPPGNMSRNPSSEDYRPDTCILQEIYVSQEQDRPYFDNFSPSADDVVDTLVIKGSIYEDHGFDNNGTLRGDSVRIWLSNTTEPAPTAAALADFLKEGAGNTLTGFTGPVDLKPGHFTLSGKNINVNINLNEYTEFAPISNGAKQYIIEAIDSNSSTSSNNSGKIKDDGSPANEDTRRSRRQHYFFAYDDKDPVIEITSPESPTSFGVTAGSVFNLEGWFEDAYLSKQNGNYYIKYRLDAEDIKTWELSSTPPRGFVSEGTNANDETRVYFNIPAGMVTGASTPFLFDFAGLAPGPHTLTLIVEDQSRKTGTALLSFIKDTLPPEINFTNIDKRSVSPQDIPTATIGNWWAKPGALTEKAWYDNKRIWLVTNPVSVIYYPDGVPELTGTFTDETSDIKTDSIRYLFDNTTASDWNSALTNIVLDGSGRNISWRIYLTENGEPNGEPLSDGIHTIRLTVADVCGNVLNDNPTTATMFAFRIVSSVLPKATITTGTPTVPPAAPASNITGYGHTVFGNANGFTNAGGANPNHIFTVFGTAESPNLKDIRLRIVETQNRTVLFDHHLIKDGSVPAVANNIFLDWDYDASVNPPKNEIIKWEYYITKTLYNDTLTYSSTRLSHGISYDVIAEAVSQYQDTLSEQAVWTFTPDMAGPVVTFAGDAGTNAGDLNPVQLHAANATAKAFEVIGGQNLKLQGGVQDGVSRITALEYKIWKWNYTTGVWALHPSSSPGWTEMPGFDAATNTSKDVNWTLDLSATTLVGGVQVPVYPEGLYRIKVQAKDASFIRNPATPERGDSGDFNPGGMGNPVTSNYMYFFYDRFGPDGFDPKVDSFYSSRLLGGSITFKGTATEPYTVTDPNRIRSVSVRVIDGPEGNIPASMTSTPWTPPDANVGPETREWELTLRAPFTGVGAVPDGRYRLEFVAEDMAGNKRTITRTFTLDNTPPIGTVILPEKRPAVPGIPDYASIVVTGGEDGEITGETADPSANKAESGVKAMWYHLGYINPASDAAPTNAATYTTFFNNNRVWERGLPAGINRENDTGANDAFFDTAAKANGNTWFKYEATGAAGGPWPHPTGFIINTINIYDWRMELPHNYPATGWDLSVASNNGNSSSLSPDPRGGFKQYDNPIKIKGTDYNGTGQPRMTVPVPEAVAGRAGVVSLPLWLRVVDNAGNVSYSCRDIWIYPDGDIPATSILNPEQAVLDPNTNRINGRAGTISADGTATNNTAVYSVIYRIKVDSNQVPLAPANATAQIVKFPNDSTEVTLGDYPLEYNKLPTTPTNYQTDGWYHANLEVAQGEPVAPWNFLFNTTNEITNLIPSLGFASGGSGSPDMIRVYMEVFVFSGSTAPEQISINTGTKAAPVPYVRTFYLKEGAPTITGVMVSTVDNSPTYRDAGGATQNATQDGSIWYEPYRAGLAPRRGQFYIRANLDAANNQSLSQITVRRKDDLDTGYQPVWENGTSNNVRGVTITPTVAQQNHVIRYAFDSTADTNNFARVRNEQWARSGGRYGLEIRIRNNSTPPGEISYLLEVGIDNFAPVADPNHTSSKKAAGTNVSFIGRVFDYQGSPNANDMPRKVEKVYVWFTKTINGQANYVNFNTGATQLATGNTGTRTDIYRNRNATIVKTGDRVTDINFASPTSIGAPATVTFPGAGTGTGATFNVSGGWVKEISEITAQPGSGMTWIPTNDWDIQWVFLADTTKMPDGRITLNYVVVDGAGNASFYTQEDIYIRNKYPEITKVTLYTDNNGVGAVYTTHDTNSVASTEFMIRDGDGNISYDNPERGYLNSGFISKNQFIGFKVETRLGNAPLAYRLQYVTRGELKGAGTPTNPWVREPIALNLATLTQMVADRNDPTKINLYTIAEHGDYSANSWATLGVNASGGLPPLGTHFVFTPETLTPEMTRSDSAKVWRYTLIQQRPVARPGTANDPNLPVLPNESNAAQEPGHNFNFNSASNHFDPAQHTGNTSNKICEFNGSHPDEDEAALDNPSDTAFFLIKVWDTVNPEKAGDENEQLYDAVVVGMNVYLNDKDPPKSRLYDLNPYAESAVIGNNIGADNQRDTRNNAMDPKAIGENILRGGLFNTGTDTEMAKSGHIEPRNGTTALMPLVKNTAGTYDAFPADGFVEGDGGPNANRNIWKDTTNVAQDQVSGRVILRGVAWDNQLIREIRVQIGGGAATTILRLDVTGNAQTNPNFRTIQPVAGIQALAVEEMHWKTGHTVEWAYIWDSETVPNTDGRPAANVPVNVTVVDHLGNNNAGLTSPPVTLTQESQANEIFHNTVNVDIVPYVSGFERATRFATKRSRQGWYSFYQGEEGIRARGFNLLGTGNTTMNLTNGTSTYPLTVSNPTKSSVTFNVPANATSGKITLTVGAQEALNHRTGHDIQSWNREYHLYTDGSDLWLNKSFAHVLRSTHQNNAPVTYFGNNTATGGSMALQRPAMALEYTGGSSGRLTGVWAVYANAGYYFGRNDTQARTTLWDNQGEPFAGTDVSFYNGSVTNGATVVALENDGRPYLIIGGGNNFATRTEASPNLAASATNPTFPTNRWMHNRVVRSGNYSHVSSYDSALSNLYYARGADRMTIDGAGVNTGAGIAVSTNAGMYSAIDYDNVGPVIAYFDTANDTIRLAYASQENPAAGNWTRRYVLDNTHPLFRGSGTYVSIKVDRTNGIHLAFYNSVYQTVVYAYAASRTGTFTAYTVDNVVKGGAWTNISVNNDGDPTIVYADSARTGNYDGIRMAYKSRAGTGTIAFTRALRCPVTDEVITGWEALTVPADFQVNDDRLNVEVWPPTNRAGGNLGTRPATDTWNAAVGYASRRISGKDEGMFRLAYFYQPAWKDYTE